MHPYIPHLLEDIAAACRTEQSFLDFPKTFEEEMEEVERWCEGEDPPHTFGYWCGLNKENFPPAEQLSNEELILVCKAFEKMMFSWNLDIDLPDTLPPSIRYGFTIDTLNEKTSIPSSGMMGFDFCTGYAPDCVFKEYCPCLKIWNEIKDDDNSDPDLSNENECPF